MELRDFADPAPLHHSDAEHARLFQPLEAQDGRRCGLLFVVRSFGVVAGLLALLALAAWCASPSGLRGHEKTATVSRGRLDDVLLKKQSYDADETMEVAGPGSGRDREEADRRRTPQESTSDKQKESSSRKHLSHSNSNSSKSSGSARSKATTTPPPTPPPKPVSDAQLFQFYMYRASSDKAADYEFGNINTGNIDGVVWYMQNEVVTAYNEGPQCPRKFNISQINRYHVKTRATQELFETGVNFGARYSYDFGQCMGRCFPGNQCTGKHDCDYHNDKFGFNVGCNKFSDNYPFPQGESHAPAGIWYSLPLEGRCEGEPTGAPDCTWSYEEAGVVTLAEVEAQLPWGENCCPADKCTGMWDNPFDDGTTSWRVQLVHDKFREKYPDSPDELWPAPCDFYKESWYTSDNDWWEPRDPWAAVAAEDNGDNS